MIGCFRKQPIIALYFESENELKFYNLQARYATISEYKGVFLCQLQQNKMVKNCDILDFLWEIRLDIACESSLICFIEQQQHLKMSSAAKFR